LHLREKKQPIDSLTVSQELDNAGLLNDIGGPIYLTGLLNQVPTTLHAEAYGEIIKATSLRRRLLAAANRIAALSYDTKTSADGIAEQATAAVREAVTSISRDASHSFAEVSLDLYDRALERDRAAKAGKPVVNRRIPTDWKDVNLLLKGGFAPGKLYVVAARPGDGKTTWLANVCLQAALAGKQPVFFSLEMDDAELVARLLSGESGLDANKITDGLLADDDWTSFVGALEMVSRAKGRVEYTPSLSVDRLRAKAHRIQQKFGLDLLIVDYIQLLRASGREQNREQVVATISRELKILAGELGVPVIAAAQLSREVEKRAEKKPQLSDLRESGALEQDADAVIFLWRPDQNTNVTTVDFAKHRGGPVGSVDLFFDKAITKFRNVAKKVTK
jgi:replicative DNA helicase